MRITTSEPSVGLGAFYCRAGSWSGGSAAGRRAGGSRLARSHRNTGQLCVHKLPYRASCQTQCHHVVGRHVIIKTNESFLKHEEQAARLTACVPWSTRASTRTWAEVMPNIGTCHDLRRMGAQIVHDITSTFSFLAASNALLFDGSSCCCSEGFALHSQTKPN